MKRLLKLAFFLWVGRWALLQGAALLARRRPRGTPPKDLPRAPGWMPGPFD